MVMVAKTRDALQHNLEAMNAALTRLDLKVEVKSDESGEKGRGVSGNDW